MKSSMKRDLVKALPLEANHLQGYLLQHAQDISVPILETIYTKLRIHENNRLNKNKTRSVDFGSCFSIYRITSLFLVTYRPLNPEKVRFNPFHWQWFAEVESLHLVTAMLM